MPADTPRPDYSEMVPKWQRVRDCFGGRDAILKAGDHYVPNLPGADKAGNEAYRKRGNFFNAVGRTVRGMNGAIFQEAPEPKVPASADGLLADFTLSGTTFESFATEVGQELFITGRSGVLVDMTAVAPSRPFCIAYAAEQIINWRVERRGGDDMLVLLVLLEEAETPKDDDKFETKCTQQFRVFELLADGCHVAVYEKEKDKKELKVVTADVLLMRRGDALQFIPFVFMNAVKPTADLLQPPLLDLADVNLGHWRNSVDHEHGLHLVALPTPWVSGAKSSGPNGAPMKIGPSVVWELDIQGQAGMLEFQGTGLASLVASMEEKKKQMATLGARLLEDAPSVGETASAVKLRHAGETASLKTVAQSLEQGLMQVLQICLWWQGTEAVPSDVEAEVELNKEYLNVRATPQEVQVALTALQAGEMSFATWWNILSTGGWAREGVSAEDEQQEIARRKVDVTPPTPIPELDNTH